MIWKTWIGLCCEIGVFASLLLWEKQVSGYAVSSWLGFGIFIGNWCDSLHVTAFHLRFSPQVLGYHLECSQISHFPLPAAKLFWSSPVPFWVPDMSCVGTSHDNFGAPHKWIGVTCPKHCYLRGFRHLTPFHSKTWIALVASCGDPWSQFLWVALFGIKRFEIWEDHGRPKT